MLRITPASGAHTRSIWQWGQTKITYFETNPNATDCPFIRHKSSAVISTLGLRNCSKKIRVHAHNEVASNWCAANTNALGHLAFECPTARGKRIIAIRVTQRIFGINTHSYHRSTYTQISENAYTHTHKTRRFIARARTQFTAFKCGFRMRTRRKDTTIWMTAIDNQPLQRNQT